MNVVKKKILIQHIHTVQKKFDNEGRCVNLENFAFDATKNAYRLPTEAEWIMVANKNWNIKNAWTANNSDYKIHEVCSIKKDENVCDMAGNAMEFVNDILGRFYDTTVTNYAGVLNSNDLCRQIVKGGSFKNFADNINTYSRGDVYTVTKSTYADYVGFRLAFGAIPNATFLTAEGSASSKIELVVSSQLLKNYFKTNQIKLIFRDDISGNLIYTNYALGDVSAIEFKDGIDVYHPEISPNGKFVAFCTGIEGVNGKSEVYVRSLDSTDAKPIKLNVDNAAIPRWQILDGDTVIVYVTNAGNNSDEATFKAASTWQVKFENEKFGTPKKLFDGAYHDGLSSDKNLAVTGARLLRARINKTDTIWYNGEQACNVSLSNDNTKRTLFLDFGGETGRKFAKETYGTHERILIADSAGKLLKIIHSPEGFSFDNTEWVNSDFAIATLTNINGAHRKIVLVNINDNSFVDIARSEELLHPNLWIKQKSIAQQNSQLDADSAGVYASSKSNLHDLNIRYKMELLWLYKDSANVVILGSSRPLGSLSPAAFSSKFFAINLSVASSSLFFYRDFLFNYILPHVKNLKYIVISLDFDYWWVCDGVNCDNLFGNLFENFFAEDYKNYPGYVYDKNHDYWVNEYHNELLDFTENGISTQKERYMSDRGRVIDDFCGTWGGYPPAIDVDSTIFDKKENRVQHHLIVLKQIIEALQTKEIFVVGMTFPLSPYYKETGAYGRYGLRRSRAIKLIDELKNMENEYWNFKFLDENKMGNHDYSDNEAANVDHLCSAAVPKITYRLDSLLQTLK